MRAFKRLISAVLSAVMLLAVSITVMTASAEAAQYTLTGINTSRDEGALIVYTPDFGDTTNTNQWGAEAVIDEDGKCISVSTGGNSAIPEGGFVVSGHDANDESAPQNATLIKSSIKVGDYVYYNDKSMTLTVSDAPMAFSREYTVSRKIDGTNVYRGENMLVIYDRANTRTATNEWGVEVTVKDGTVVSVGGNNGTVPKGGFIVSGHGDSREWINTNVYVGMSAEIDGGNIVFTYTASTAALSLQSGIDDLKASLDNAKKQCLLIDREKADAAVNAAGSAADSALTKQGSDDFWQYLETAEQLIETAALTLVESQRVEYRGVWLRPVQTTAKAVDDYVQKLYDSGINLICIETLYDNCMIMPMPESSLFEQNPSWKGFDMLQAFIDSCHSRGMELHLWLPVYYVGHEDSTNYTLSVGFKKPEWLSITNKGKPMGESNPSKFYMLDPSNPEVKQFLSETYKWILQKYDVDGIELDYIRYWERGAEDYGYNKALVDAFREKYGVTPEYNTNASYWNDWCKFRAEFVTDMVRNVRKIIDETRPATLLSLDVGGYPDVAMNYLYQDYLLWLEEGMVDLLHPMCYGEHYDNVFIDLAKRCGTRTALSVGLGTFDSVIPTDCIKRQAILVNNVGGNGSCFFEATSYFNRMMPKLLSGLYSNRAMTLRNGTEALKQKRGDMSSRLDLMKQNGLVTQDAADAILQKADSLCKSGVTDAEIAELISLANGIKNSDAKDMLLHDMRTFARVLALSDMMDWSPDEFIPDPPSDDPISDPSSDESSTESETESTPEQSDQPSDESKTDSQNGAVSPAVIAVIAVVAVAAIAAAVVIVIKRKK